MPEFFRVRDKATKHEYSVTVVDEDLHELLDDEPALSADGVPLPAKLHHDEDQPEPPAPGTVVVDESNPGSDDGEQAAGKYEGRTKDDLKAEAVARGVEVPPPGNKSDLVAALTAADEAEHTVNHSQED